MEIDRLARPVRAGDGGSRTDSSRAEPPAAEGSADERSAAALARLYDLDLIDDPGDLDLYLAMADRVRGSILELAAGSGRLAVPLAALGRDVTAVDIDPQMLLRAEARARAIGRNVRRHLTLVQADIVGLRLEGDGPAPMPTFGLAILALNSLMLLGDRDRQAAALRAMALHLAPGGLAVVDVWLPDAEDLARYDGRLILEYLRQEPETGHWITKAGSALHDAATGTVALTTIYEEGEQGRAAVRWVRHDRLRLVGADELRRMAEEAGLDVEVLAGSYGLDPLRSGDERAVLVARRPQTASRRVRQTTPRHTSASRPARQQTAPTDSVRSAAPRPSSGPGLV